MGDLRELYQQIILDHNRSPRNFRIIEAPDRTAEGNNPLCGDRFTVSLKLERNRIVDVAFQGSGCAISKASASLMTEAVKGRTISEAEACFRNFRAMVTSGAALPDAQDKLAVFSGLSEFPTRVKCATLSWHALHAALTNRSKKITTE